MMKILAVGMLVVVTGFLFCAVTTLPGCDGVDIAQFKLAVAKAEADLAKVQADVASLPEGPEKKKAQELLVLVDARMKSLNAQLKRVEDEPDLMVAVSREIGMAVPAPFGSWIALVGVALAGVWRAARNKAAAVNIVKTVDEVLTDEQKALITGQTAVAKRIVDEAQGKTKIQLPV